MHFAIIHRDDPDVETQRLFLLGVPAHSREAGAVVARAIRIQRRGAPVWVESGRRVAWVRSPPLHLKRGAVEADGVVAELVGLRDGHLRDSFHLLLAARCHIANPTGMAISGSGRRRRSASHGRRILHHLRANHPGRRHGAGELRKEEVHAEAVACDGRLALINVDQRADDALWLARLEDGGELSELCHREGAVYLPAALRRVEAMDRAVGPAELEGPGAAQARAADPGRMEGARARDPCRQRVEHARLDELRLHLTSQVRVVAAHDEAPKSVGRDEPVRRAQRAARLEDMDVLAEAFIHQRVVRECPLPSRPRRAPLAAVVRGVGPGLQYPFHNRIALKQIGPHVEDAAQSSIAAGILFDNGHHPAAGAFPRQTALAE
mmetsp:Transcript_31640/g.101172  ORF Transcript_31640/g.101172 Transcript_31640/m.101172 type:complete len:379 (-) Transcript_31640:811-1947(-)